jgi:hypothetical protein
MKLFSQLKPEEPKEREEKEAKNKSNKSSNKMVASTPTINPLPEWCKHTNEKKSMSNWVKKTKPN